MCYNSCPNWKPYLETCSNYRGCPDDSEELVDEENQEIQDPIDYDALRERLHEMQEEFKMKRKLNL